MGEQVAGVVGDGVMFDPQSAEFREDPYRFYRRMREQAPVYRTPEGFWMFTRHTDCMTVLQDPHWVMMEGYACVSDADSSSVDRPALKGPREYMNSPEDVPDSSSKSTDRSALKEAITKVLTPRVVRVLEPRIRQLCDELVGAAVRAGEVDLMEAFAYPLTSTVICELLGAPAADRELFTTWSNALARGVDPLYILSEQEVTEVEQASQEFAEYFRDLITTRRQHPADDLVSALITLEGADGAINETELIATCTLLLTAGHATTVHLIGNGTLALLNHPDQLTLLRNNPNLITTAIEELLRYDSPVQLLPRQATQNTTIAGHTIEQGEHAVILFGAANRDPDTFPNPDQLDLTRTNNRHLAFGHGIHYCIGATLARLEGHIAFTTLLTHTPTLAAPPQRKPNFGLRGLETLPITLH